MIAKSKTYIFIDTAIARQSYCVIRFLDSAEEIYLDASQ